MHIHEGILLFFAAMIAGGLNAVAGGGSFITFPILLMTGMRPIQANATNTSALWPGSFASVIGFRNQLAQVDRGFLTKLTLISLVGGATGAIILLHTPQQTFAKMIPWLLLAATLVFTFGRRALNIMRGERDKHEPHIVVAMMLQFVVSVYGGFFGAGMGILMLAILTLMGMEEIHRMNALTSVFAAVINCVAAIAFVIARVVEWRQALVMLVGCVLGGYWAAEYSQRVDPKYVRAFVMVVAFSMTAYFFWKVYH